MPWPPTVNNGQLTDAAQYNNLLNSTEVWPGNVSAGGFALTNVSKISAQSNALTLDATSGVTFNGPQLWGGNANAGGFSISNLSALTVNGPVTATGLISANGGVTLPNNTSVSFLDSTNTFPAAIVNVGPGGNLNFYGKTSAGAGATNNFNITQAGAVNIPGTLSVTGAATISGLLTTAGISASSDIATATQLRSTSAIIGPPGSGDPLQVKGTDGNVWTSGSSAANGGAYFWTNSAKFSFLSPLVATGTLTVNGASTLTGTVSMVGALTITASGVASQPTITSSTGYLMVNNSFRIAAGKDLSLYTPDNSKTGGLQMSGDNSGNIYVSSASGASIILNNAQVWAGQVNANSQKLLNVNQLTVQSSGIQSNGNIAVNAAGLFQAWNSDGSKQSYFYTDTSGNMQVLSSSGVQYLQSVYTSNTLTVGGGTFILNGPSSKYFQVLPNDGTYPDPRIYSNTGNIRCFTGMSFDGMVNFYTASNLTFGSNWQSWTPTLTANAGTITPTGWYYAGWMRIGPLVFFSLRFAFNASAAFNYLYVTMPVTGYTPSNSYMHVGQCFCEQGPLTLENLCMRWENADHVVVQRAGGAGYALGNGYMFIMSGFYRIV